MTDETDTVTEVARVLLLHASFKASPEIQETDTPWSWQCDGCDTTISLGGTGRNTVFSGLAKHQAAMLAEAGLLREEAAASGLGERLRAAEAMAWRLEIAYRAFCAEGGYAEEEIEAGLQRMREEVNEPCDHASESGDEGPIADLGRMPTRWRCDSCGRVREDGQDVQHTATSSPAPSGGTPGGPESATGAPGATERVLELAQRWEREGQTGIARMVREGDGA